MGLMTFPALSPERHLMDYISSTNELFYSIIRLQNIFFSFTWPKERLEPLSPFCVIDFTWFYIWDAGKSHQRFSLFPTKKNVKDVKLCMY